MTRDGVLKLGDFGLARNLNNSKDMATTQIGTWLYMSPEVINEEPYNKKSDVWSLGCVV